MAQLFKDGVDNEYNELFYQIFLEAKRKTSVLELAKMRDQVIGSRYFGELLYDAEIFPLMSNVSRDFFADNYVAILDAMASAGVHESYIVLIKQALGESTPIVFSYPRPGHLIIKMGDSPKSVYPLETDAGQNILTDSGQNILAEVRRSDYTQNQLRKALEVLANAAGTYLELKPLTMPQTLVISSPSVEMEAGEQMQMTATVTYEDGTSDTDALWSSDSVSVSVDNLGLATANFRGYSVIRAESPLDSAVADMKTVKVIADVVLSSQLTVGVIDGFLYGFDKLAGYGYLDEHHLTDGVEVLAIIALKDSSFVTHAALPARTREMAYRSDGTLFTTNSNRKVYMCPRGGSFVEYGNHPGTSPTGIKINSKGDVFVADQYTQRVYVSKSGADFVEYGNLLSGGGYPTQLAIDSNDNVFVLVPSKKTVYVSKSGADFVEYGMYSGASLGYIDINSKDDVFVTDPSGMRVYVSKAGADFVEYASISSGASPSRIAIDSNDNVFVLTNSVYVSKAGADFVEYGMYSGASPNRIAIDSNDNVFITDLSLRCVWASFSGGCFIQYGNYPLSSPDAINTSPVDGRITVSDVYDYILHAERTTKTAKKTTIVIKDNSADSGVVSVAFDGALTDSKILFNSAAEFVVGVDDGGITNKIIQRVNKTYDVTINFKG